MYQKLIRKGWAPILLLLLGITLFSGSQLRHFMIDSGTSVLLDDGDPDLAFYNQSRVDWGYDEYTIVCLHREDWFTPEGIALLNEFTEALRKAPNVLSITAINTVPLLRNRPPNPLQLLTNPKKIPVRLDTGKNVDLDKAKEELTQHTQARGNIISPDGKDISILVYLTIPEGLRELEPEWNDLNSRKDDPEAQKRLKEIWPEYDRILRVWRGQREEQVKGIREICAEWQPKFEEPIRLSGLPVINVGMVEHVESDMKTFGIAAVAMFSLAFLVVFRTVRWTILPILTCLIPVIIVMGTMTLLDKRMTVISSNMPVLLFILLLPYTVYFIDRYRESRSRNPEEDSSTSATNAARAIGMPCFFSAITSMAGVASLMTSGIVPVHTFGMMMAIGIAVGFGTVFLFLPSAVRPLPARSTAPPPGGKSLRFLASISLRIPGPVVLLSLVIFGVAVYGTTKLDPETKFIDYFKEESEIYSGLDYIDNRMGGLTPMEVILRSEEKGFFKTPEGLAAIASAQEYFTTVPQSGSIRSLRTLLDEIRKYLKGIRLKLEDPKILTMLQPVMKEEIREFCNEDYTVSRILVRFRETDPDLNRKTIIDGWHEYAAKDPTLNGLLAQSDVTVHLAGPTDRFFGTTEGLAAIDAVHRLAKETGKISSLRSEVEEIRKKKPSLSEKSALRKIPSSRRKKSTTVTIRVDREKAEELATTLRAGIKSDKTLSQLETSVEKHRLLTDVTPTGVFLLYSNMLQSLLKGLQETFLMVVLVIYLMLVILFRAPILALLVLLSQTLPVFIVLGTMGLFGIHLDMVTTMIAAVAMGVGIDGAIQYTFRYRKEILETQSHEEAIKRTHGTIGRAIAIAGAIVFSGFSVLMLSGFNPTIYFGLFTGLALLMGLFSSLTLLPSLFRLLRYPRIPREAEPSP